MSIRLPDVITLRQAYGPAMHMTEQAEADEWFEALVEHSMRVGKRTREKAELVERANLGYYAGYYDKETRARVERLFKCEHPIFGKVEKSGPVTPERALAAGIAAGLFR